LQIWITGRAAAIFAGILFFGLGTPLRGAAPLQLSKPQIEAAYLFNFARFVEWPGTVFADEHAPLVVGILGQDPFGSLLDDLVAGEKIHGRSLVVRRFTRVQEIGDCHILFISHSESDRVAQICAALQSRHILTVSDIPDFARHGGIIEFVQDADRIRFRISLKRARAELLEVSAKLLRPAEVISKNVPGARPAAALLSFAERALPAELVDRVLPALADWVRLPEASQLSQAFFGGSLP